MINLSCMYVTWFCHDQKKKIDKIELYPLNSLNDFFVFLLQYHTFEIRSHSLMHRLKTAISLWTYLLNLHWLNSVFFQWLLQKPPRWHPTSLFVFPLLLFRSLYLPSTKSNPPSSYFLVDGRALEFALLNLSHRQGHTLSLTVELSWGRGVRSHIYIHIYISLLKGGRSLLFSWWDFLSCIAGRWLSLSLQFIVLEYSSSISITEYPSILPYGHSKPAHLKSRISLRVSLDDRRLWILRTWASFILLGDLLVSQLGMGWKSMLREGCFKFQKHRGPHSSLWRFRFESENRALCLRFLSRSTDESLPLINYLSRNLSFHISSLFTQKKMCVQRMKFGIKFWKWCKPSVTWEGMVICAL